jgi:hypothetical protein
MVKIPETTVESISAELDDIYDKEFTALNLSFIADNKVAKCLNI